MDIDKIKGKELIDSIVLHLTMYERNGDKEMLKLAYQNLDELREEIDAPGWISVFKQKPNDYEVVEVCNIRVPSSVRRVRYTSLFDTNNGFVRLVANHEITHWRRIKDNE